MVMLIGINTVSLPIKEVLSTDTVAEAVANEISRSATTITADPAAPAATKISVIEEDSLLKKTTLVDIGKNASALANKLLGVEKLENPTFETFSKNYIKTVPEILFVAEYVIEGKTIGSLLVFERFFDSTHYEVFKKNIFQDNAIFERILFIDDQSLKEETRHYMQYLNGVLGFSLDENRIFVILDTAIKEDRIYEYKITAARVPKSAIEVDYDFILESKNLLNEVVVDEFSDNALFDFAGVTLGSKDLAWTIALLNERVLLFGRSGLEKKLSSLDLETTIDGEKRVFVAKNLGNIIDIMNNSYSFFGVSPTMDRLIDSLGGLPKSLKSSFLESIDEANRAFSYDVFRSSALKLSPAFSLALQVSESGNTDAVDALSKLSIVVPLDSGLSSITSIEELTKIIKFVNNVYVSISYAQDNAAAVQEILTKVQEGTTFSTDPVVQALDEVAHADTTQEIVNTTIKSAFELLGSVTK